MFFIMTLLILLNASVLQAENEMPVLSLCVPPLMRLLPILTAALCFEFLLFPDLLPMV